MQPWHWPRVGPHSPPGTCPSALASGLQVGAALRLGFSPSLTVTVATNIRQRAQGFNFESRNETRILAGWTLFPNGQKLGFQRLHIATVAWPTQRGKAGRWPPSCWIHLREASDRTVGLSELSAAPDPPPGTLKEHVLGLCQPGS